jgi:tetratricopeptide (TPR) repeat protein
MARFFRDNLRNYDSSMVYADKVYALVLKKSFPSACKWPEAWVYGEKGIAFYQLGQIDSAIYFESKCIEYCKKNKLINKEVDSGSRIIYCYYTIGNFRKAYDYIVDYDKKINPKP